MCWAISCWLFFVFCVSDSIEDEMEMATVRHRPEALALLEAQSRFTKKELQILYRGFKNVSGPSCKFKWQFLVNFGDVQRFLYCNWKTDYLGLKYFWAPNLQYGWWWLITWLPSQWECFILQLASYNLHLWQNETVIAAVINLSSQWLCGMPWTSGTSQEIAQTIKHALGM